MKSVKLFCSMALAAISFSSAGAVITGNATCDVSSVKISSIVTNPGGVPITGTPNPTYPIEATSCLGYVTDPANDWGNNPTPNIGLLGEGLLNQELNKSGDYISGSHFLTNANDSMVDIDGDGIADDPGWIRLGGAEANNDTLNFQYDSVNGFNLANVLDISFSMDGTWSLNIDPSAVEAASLALGRPSVFDHLAFVMKGPNPNSGEESSGWAIYDFNFYDLIDEGLNINLNETHNFTGLWDSSGIFDGQQLSHLSVWAHDPPTSVPPNEVSAPKVLPVLLLSLLCIGLRQRAQRHRW